MLRNSIIAELDAINLYENFSKMTDDKEISNVMRRVANEEKVHVGEFQFLLLKTDPTQRDALFEGEKEVKEKRGFV